MAVYEIAIMVKNAPGGIEEGDILTCRKPAGGIGKSEAGICIWIKVELGEKLAEQIREPIYDVNGKSVLVKRRYKITLDKIKELNAEFDLNRAKDHIDKYQPYLEIDKDYLFVDPNPQILELEKLKIIWDKQTETYI
jgi:hypothetical protein